MRHLMIPSLVVFSCLIVLLIYFGMKAQSYEESKYNKAIAFVWKVKQHNTESNTIPIEYLVEYQKYNESLKQDRKKYQSIMLIASICFILLFACFMFIMSRNSVVLFREKARSKTALSSINDGVIVINESGLIEFINPAAEKLTEHKNEKVVGQPIEHVFNLVNEKTHQPVENSVRSCLRNSEVISEGEHTALVTSTNEPIAIKHSVAPILDHNQQLSGAVLVFEDVTISRRMARELEWAATHDSLTGLVNRREFGNRIVEALITAQLDKQNHALLYMDLDKFKAVNDAGGHAAGDALLIQVVKSIRSVLRSSDTFARLGGDEFAVLLTYCPLINSVQVANKIIKVVQELDFEWKDQGFNVGVSLGVTGIDQYSKSDSSVMSLADDACYIAKNDGRNCIRVIEIKKGVVRKRYTGEDVLKADFKLH
ncbi:MAG: diguanylate cyclase [Gammaproteobacteria bacterium]|nr:diguanylate cyclase [Gammaproteobacteria bacterium]